MVPAAAGGDVGVAVGLGVGVAVGRAVAVGVGVTRGLGDAVADEEALADGEADPGVATVTDTLARTVAVAFRGPFMARAVIVWLPTAATAGTFRLVLKAPLRSVRALGIDVVAPSQAS
jgi:hypothetical protein